MIVEMASAFANAERNGHMSTSERERTVTIFRHACSVEYRLIALSRMLLAAAAEVASEHHVRSLDAIHIATALTVEAETRHEDGVCFVTADRRQSRVAIALGLATEVIG